MTPTPFPAAPSSAEDRRVDPGAISIQLHTLRELLDRDLDGTLERLAEIGFTRVEIAGVPGGLAAAAFRERLDAHGLRATSGHLWIADPVADPDAWRRSIEDALVLGHTYLVLSAAGIRGWSPATGADAFGSEAEWLPFIERLNRAGEEANAHGLRFGVHNHAWEFGALADSPRTGYDLLLAGTGPELVSLEVDLYWAWYGHHDPAQIVRFVDDRIRQFHVKDMRMDGGTMTFADPGEGIIDFARIFAQKEDTDGVEFIIERDDAGAGALTTARVGYEFLRDVRF